MNQSFVSPGIRARVRGLAVPIAVGLGRLGITPNGLTLIGFTGTVGAALAAAGQAWLLAGILVLVFGIFDLFDGALARATGRATRFGAFLDSTLDRTGENLVYAGIAFGSAMAGFPLGVGLAGLAVAFASVVTYTRAKAEALDLDGEVGFAPRPERLVILAAGLILGGALGGVRATDCGSLFCLDDPAVLGRSALGIALALITVLSAITVVQRILHTKAQLDHLER